MASAFNSNEADCINRCAEVEKEIGSIDEIWTADRLLECTTWIESEQFKRVLLVLGEFVAVCSALGS